MTGLACYTRSQQGGQVKTVNAILPERTEGYMIVYRDGQIHNVGNTDKLYAYHLCKRRFKSEASPRNHIRAHSRALGNE